MGGGRTIRHGGEPIWIRDLWRTTSALGGVGAFNPRPIGNQTANPFSATLLNREPFFIVSNFDHWLDLESVGNPVVQPSTSASRNSTLPQCLSVMAPTPARRIRSIS
jgi:hypothetical protein